MGLVSFRVRPSDVVFYRVYVNAGSANVVRFCGEPASGIYGHICIDMQVGDQIHRMSIPCSVKDIPNDIDVGLFMNFWAQGIGDDIEQRVFVTASPDRIVRFQSRNCHEYLEQFMSAYRGEG